MLGPQIIRYLYLVGQCDYVISSVIFVRNIRGAIQWLLKQNCKCVVFLRFNVKKNKKLGNITMQKISSNRRLYFSLKSKVVTHQHLFGNSFQKIFCLKNQVFNLKSLATSTATFLRYFTVYLPFGLSRKQRNNRVFHCLSIIF